MSQKPLRILYASNAPWCGSGYGVQGRSLLARLKALPEVDDIAIFAWFGLQGGMLNAQGMRVYPAGRDPYGNDMYGIYAKHFGADLVVTLIDAWVIQPKIVQEIAPALWAPWFPVDHDPIPPKVLEAVRPAQIPITYAKFGHDTAKAAGIDNVYIPHGVEPTVYRVRPEEDTAGFRRAVGEDPSFLAVMVAANKGWPSRKGFEEVFLAWKEFVDVEPGAILYVHADWDKTIGGGNLAAMAKSLGLQDNVRFPSREKLWIGEYNDDYLSLVYNAADVFLGPAKGEGFGIPIIEAQACGTPVVVTDYTSMTELVRWGHALKPERLTWTYMDSWQAVTRPEDVLKALKLVRAEKAGLSPEQYQEKRLACSQAIHNEYGWDDLVKDHWQPLMQRIQAGDFARQQPTTEVVSNGSS